jgi:tetratricopeptide (TPR) repeat protein
MPSKPKTPWFRSDRNAYFVTFRGKQHNLGPEKVEAERLFHELLGRKPAKIPPRPLASGLAESRHRTNAMCAPAISESNGMFDWLKKQKGLGSNAPSAEQALARGLASVKQGELRRAVDEYSEAIRLAPSFAHPYNGRAATYNALMESENAYIDATEAIRLDSAYGVAFVTRAYALQWKTLTCDVNLGTTSDGTQIHIPIGRMSTRPIVSS